MNLTVKGKNIDVGDALKTRASESLDHIFGKYFSNPIEANVTMSREAHLFTAQISVHVGRGILLQSEGAAEQANSAYDTRRGNAGEAPAPVQAPPARPSSRGDGGSPRLPILCAGAGSRRG